MTLLGEEAARITQYLEVQTRLPDEADLVFVFGTGTLNRPASRHI